MTKPITYCDDKTIALSPRPGGVPDFLSTAYMAAIEGQMEQARTLLTADALAKIDQHVKGQATDSMQVWFLVGQIVQMQGRLQEAADYYRKALGYEDNSVVWHELADLYMKIGQYTQALACRERSYQLDDQLLPWQQAAYAENLIQVGQVAKGVALLEKLVNSGQVSSMVGTQFLWMLQYLPEVSKQTVHDRHVAWGRQYAPMSLARTQHPHDPDPNRRLRIGYISADFRTHSVTYTFEAALIGGGRDRLELFGYGNVERPDEKTAWLQDRFDHYRDIYGLDDEAVVSLIEQDRIDILVTLAGHSGGHRLTALAYKPAPIQVSLGGVSTMGMPQIDYHMTDTCMDPVENHGYYLEKVVTLPNGLLSYIPRNDVPDVGPLPCLKQGYVTFGSFAHHLKMSETTLDLWGGVLREIPTARLILKTPGGNDAGITEALFAALERRGVDRKRVEIYGWLPGKEHWALYNRVDIALDTYPFNGCMTSLEGLWMGVPLVTLVGDRVLARMGYSVLKHVGLEFFASDHPQRYLSQAVTLARRPDLLGKLRAEMRDRMRSSPLCDPQRFVRELEAAYRNMWRTWCAQQTSIASVKSTSTASVQGEKPCVH